MAVRCQPARRLRQREAEQEHDQRARADDDPDAAPAKRVAEAECEQGGQRPRPGAADHLHAGDEAAADVLRRILAGIGEAQRLLGAEPDAGDEAQRGEPDVVGRERRGDGRQAVQQQVELIDRLAAEAVGELALRQRADEQAEQRGAGNGGDLRAAWRSRSAPCRGSASPGSRSRRHRRSSPRRSARTRANGSGSSGHRRATCRRSPRSSGPCLPPPAAVCAACRRERRRGGRVGSTADYSRGMVSPISVRPAASMRSRFRHASTSSPNCAGRDGETGGNGLDAAARALRSPR